jgi:hypothetical protein
MENVIQYLKDMEPESAINQYRSLNGCDLASARKDVETLRPYLDPSYSKIAEASPEPSESGLDLMSALITPDDFKGFPEAIAEPQEAKPEIDKWIITSSTSLNKDYWDWADSEDAALKRAKNLLSIKHTRVTISRVIAEAKATTTWSIDL